MESSKFAPTTSTIAVVYDLEIYWDDDVSLRSHLLKTITAYFQSSHGWNCRGGGGGWTPQFMSTDAHFWVKIGFKLQSLGKISNISAADPPLPVLLGQFQHWVQRHLRSVRRSVSRPVVQSLVTKPRLDQWSQRRDPRKCSFVSHTVASVSHERSRLADAVTQTFAQ